MKRILSHLVLMFALAVFLSPTVVAQEKTKTGKSRVAVFAFEDKSGHRWHWWNGQPPGEGMAGMLTTALVKSGRYRVFERQEIEKIMQEQALGMSGAVTPEIAIVGAITEFGYKKQSTGGLLKKVPLGGSVSRQSCTVGIDVRLINTTSGEILKAENVRKEKKNIGVSVDTENISFDNEAKFDESLVGKATREAIEDVVKLLDAQGGGDAPWEAKVVMMKDGEVIINGGSETGVKIGERFMIYRPGEEMIDPDTGESLGAEETKIGEIEVVNNNFGGKGKASACKVISGSDFQKGDLVRQK